uniref:Ribitol xylosyltransferase 1 n=1 Tax=Oncorhynchus kisutch TaxID=8019 RepID=A0A8C7DA67_ONCKI
MSFHFMIVSHLLLILHKKIQEGEIDFTPSVSTQAQGHVPLDTDSVVLVLNGQEQQKIPCATRWLQHIQTLMWVDAVNCLAVVLLGSKRCTKDWISIYLRRHGVFVDLLFLVYGSPWVNDKDVFQWPVGVATYRQFPVVTANSQMVNSTRPFLCNFLGTETAKSLRRYQTALAQSELTLCCAYGSVPVVEDIVTPGGCSAAHSSPMHLLKAAGALFIFLKDYKELPGLLEKGMSQEERTETRRRLLEWYSSFHLQMKDRFTEVLEVNRKALRRVMRSAQRITGGKLPAVQDTYSTRCHGKAKKIIKDNNHPSHCLFTQLPSRRCGHFRCIKAGSMRLKNSFCLKAIRLLNSNH